MASPPDGPNVADMGSETTAVALRADRDQTDAEGAGITALDTRGRAIGRAAYSRAYGPRALVTFRVDDEYWERGLPAALLHDLCVRASGAEISTFLMRVRAADLRLLELLREEFTARGSCSAGYVDVEFSTARRP